jgi:phosphoglycerate dehydrogenase-like enzyme
MKKLQIIRTHLSPYQAKDFLIKEKSMLEALPGINYMALADARPDCPTILITNTHTQLAKLPPELLKVTELIIHPNSGYDHFAAEKPLWDSIPLVIGHVIRAQAVAEYTLGCLFQGALQLPRQEVWDTDRQWDRPLIKGMPIWVFGYGHIGRLVADTLANLGADITVVDPYISHCQHRLVKQWREHEIKEAHAVLVCCSLNASSYHLFNQDFFEHLKDEVLFINGARGALVDGQALQAFLNHHPRAFAYLDVFEQEPFTPEWHHQPRLWKTSHIAGVHRQLDQDILNFTKNTLSDYLQLSSAEFNKKYSSELIQNKWQQGMLI